jgi:hypothetical protein
VARANTGASDQRLDAIAASRGTDWTAVTGAVVDPGDDEAASDSRSLVLVLRLVLDRHAHLTRGELFDGEARRLGHFADMGDLTEVLRRWLEQQRDAAL